MTHTPPLGYAVMAFAIIISICAVAFAVRDVEIGLAPEPHAVIVTLANHQKVNCVQAGPSVTCDWIGGAGRP